MRDCMGNRIYVSDIVLAYLPDEGHIGLRAATVHHTIPIDMGRDVFVRFQDDNEVRKVAQNATFRIRKVATNRF